jgi:hypothetical protein
MPDFKAVVIAIGSFFFALLIRLMPSAFDGQRCIFSDTLLWPDKFFQHCLSLVRYIHKRFHTFNFHRGGMHCQASYWFSIGFKQMVCTVSTCYWFLALLWFYKT